MKKRAVPGALSLGLLAVSFPLYLLRPDWAAAFTLLPALAWFVFGLILALPGVRSRVSWVALAGWLMFGIVYVEGFRSGLRLGYRISDRERAPGTHLRVVSLNCAGGLREAAAEVSAYAPDIVLFQETPSKMDLQDLARSMFQGKRGVAFGPDGSIVVRGELEPIDLPRQASNFVMAFLKVDGREIQLVSLRLMPPVGRVDLWNPECWRAQTENRLARREELKEILRFVRSHRRRGAQLVMGGDFNAVAGDPAIAPMNFLRDSFDEAGRGWPDTAVNDYPFARIDRIYVSEGLTVLASSVQRTQHSDHRMLVVDLAFTR
ncbi:MAG TPA: endonuclease/exonuclease/phosphatase family protein [Fimbriimonadaceae bacterium]|nr:endonuclease/exonuclease/phosphatase family protein [Fimbriimonadaceae bacterium]